MNGLCREEEEEEEGMVGRKDWLGGWDSGVGGRVSTSGGQCFDDHWSLGSPLCTNTHTYREPLVCRCTHFCLSFNVIRVWVISSTSLLIVQTKMSKTNGSYLIISVKDEQQWGFAEGHFVVIFHCLVSPFSLDLTIIGIICRPCRNVFILK